MVILQSLVYSQHVQVRLSHATIQVLLSNFNYIDLSVENFVRGIKV
jgi:hypothetical protein